MEPPWPSFDFAVDVTGSYGKKLEALRAYEAVFRGEQAQLLDKYTAEDRYVGSLVGVPYAEAFKARPAARQRSGSLFHVTIRVTAFHESGRNSGIRHFYVGVEHEGDISMITIKNILFPVDFSERSHAAAPFVLSLAQRYGAKVVLLHAFGPPPPIYGGMYAMYPNTYDFTGLEAELQPKLVAFAEAELPKVDTSCVVELGSPVTVITAYAEMNRMDLIAMPTHGYGPFRRALLGSVTAKVLHDAKIPVWTDAHAPEPSHRAHPKPRHILAALDLKPETRHTLEVALQLGRDAGATVEIVHAAPEGEIAPLHSNARIQQVLAEAAREQLVTVQQQAGSEVDLVVDGGSVATLVRSVALRKRSDLIVIGRGCIQGGMSRLRANAYAIIREAPCPVLSV